MNTPARDRRLVSLDNLLREEQEALIEEIHRSVEERISRGRDGFILYQSVSPEFLTDKLAVWGQARKIVQRVHGVSELGPRFVDWRARDLESLVRDPSRYWSRRVEWIDYLMNHLSASLSHWRPD